MHPEDPVLTCRNFYAGTWHDSPFDVLERHNPATGELVSVAPRSAAGEVDAAVAAAAAAFRTWRRTVPADRAGHLHRLAEVCGGRVDDLAAAITREQGKPLDEARGEVRKFVTALHYYAEEATRVFGRTIPNDTPGFTSIVAKEPIGPVAGIVPWNYPIELIGWKLAGSVAAGCTIVIKPSEYTPGSAHVLSECIAGIERRAVIQVEPIFEFENGVQTSTQVFRALQPVHGIFGCGTGFLPGAMTALIIAINEAGIDNAIERNAALGVGGNNGRARQGSDHEGLFHF